MEIEIIIPVHQQHLPAVLRHHRKTGIVDAWNRKPAGFTIVEADPPEFIAAGQVGGKDQATAVGQPFDAGDGIAPGCQTDRALLSLKACHPERGIPHAACAHESNMPPVRRQSRIQITFPRRGLGNIPGPTAAAVIGPDATMGAVLDGFGKQHQIIFAGPVPAMPDTFRARLQHRLLITDH